MRFPHMLYFFCGVAEDFFLQDMESINKFSELLPDLPENRRKLAREENKKKKEEKPKEKEMHKSELTANFVSVDEEETKEEKEAFAYNKGVLVLVRVNYLVEKFFSLITKKSFLVAAGLFLHFTGHPQDAKKMGSRNLTVAENEYFEAYKKTFCL